MNFDVQINHIVNYSTVSNVQSRAIISLVNNWLYGFCRIVNKHILNLAYQTYKTIIFTTTQVSRVINIHRFICKSRSSQIPTRAVLTRPFFVVHKSQNIL